MEAFDGKTDIDFEKFLNSTLFFTMDENPASKVIRQERLWNFAIYACEEVDRVTEVTKLIMASGSKKEIDFNAAKEIIK